MELTPSQIRDFYSLAQDHGIYLILDETYCDFRASDGVAHDLFADPDWPDTLIRLYSFSKSFHLCGHRVGTITADQAVMSEVEKYLDTITICPSGIGQAAALWGLNNLDDWLAGERQEILNRGETAAQVFRDLAAHGWELQSHGAYFAYVRHEDAKAHENASQALLAKTGVLTLPGTMFLPAEDANGSTDFRVAFANLGSDGIEEMGQRLKEFSF